MWGCIGHLWGGPVYESVPSLYVRVYRNWNSVVTGRDGSLIICEGVSTEAEYIKMQFMFPHYMWGCIILQGLVGCPLFVPSLYVRVYRVTLFVKGYARRSLIICEGVSPEYTSREWWTAFPHYMWGCIVVLYLNSGEKQVPSLYVRVYRQAQCHHSSQGCSLTIREGVSGKFATVWSRNRFPHYTWWCIALKIILTAAEIAPSLYVRVYRPIHYGSMACRCSLTIREGVSRTDANRVPGTTFPHYTWGCITPSDSRKNRGGVPSLYVSVYRTADILYRLFFYFSIHTKKYLIFQHIKYK